MNNQLDAMTFLILLAFGMFITTLDDKIKETNKRIQSIEYMMPDTVKVLPIVLDTVPENPVTIVKKVGE